MGEDEGLEETMEEGLKAATTQRRGRTRGMSTVEETGQPVLGEEVLYREEVFG